MKKMFLFLICVPFFAISQNNYELEFNGATQDFVDIPNTSAVIANKTSFSISGWVYPQSNTNHGGFMGFRNNIDSDFYLLQLQNTNNVEARFRNSSGVNYDIIAVNALDLNQWQHLAFTYDGAYIRLYKNGNIIDSTAANGIITQTTQSFTLGKLDWQGSGFYMNGRLDEIRLWDIAVSQTEINNWMCSELDNSHPNYANLMGYWNLNEGSGLTTYDQSINGHNGTLSWVIVWHMSSSCLAGSIICGDVNEDGVVDQIDINDMNNFLTGGVVPVFNLWAADVNCDNTINILDITMLSSFNAGSITSLNCCSSSSLPLTYVPDNSFEAYLENNGMGNGIQYDDSVFTSAIDTVTVLDVSGGAGTAVGIFDLTGIEDFTSLTHLDCHYNSITSLDLSNNTDLTDLDCSYNNLSTLDLSNSILLSNIQCDHNQLININIGSNTNLTNLHCGHNLLTFLDISSSQNLEGLYCHNNQLASLDVSNNTTLIEFQCMSNPLTFLNVQNGNNHNMLCDNIVPLSCYLADISTLTCIQVDDSSWAYSNWVSSIDTTFQYFSTNCSGTTSLQEFASEKKVFKITDILGRETKEIKNETLFYIYDDGTVEKKIIIE